MQTIGFVTLKNNGVASPKQCRDHPTMCQKRTDEAIITRSEVWLRPQPVF
jgi:hypothetical protein